MKGEKMNHKIVTERAAFFRKVSRAQISGRWIQLAIATAIFMIILSIVDVILTLIMPDSEIGMGISAIYAMCIYGPATVGFASYALAVVREYEPSPTLAFSGFEKALRSFSLGFQMWIRILLWTVLFIIPGIVAAYRYSMAPYICIDRPDLSPGQCIEESKRLMQGNKGRLFCVQFSFIGWILLASIPASLVDTFSADLGAFSPSPVMASIDINTGALTTNATPLSVAVSAILFIPMLFVLGYIETATAVFYEEVREPVFQY